MTEPTEASRRPDADSLARVGVNAHLTYLLGIPENELWQCQVVAESSAAREHARHRGNRQPKSHARALGTGSVEALAGGVHAMRAGNGKGRGQAKIGGMP